MESLRQAKLCYGKHRNARPLHGMKERAYIKSRRDVCYETFDAFHQIYKAIEANSDKKQLTSVVMLTPAFDLTSAMVLPPLPKTYPT